jgi:hypothetical protein
MTTARLPSRLATPAGWLEAADPGAVRRRQGARAAMAALCAWITIRLVPAQLPPRQWLAVSIFCVAASFVCSLAVADPRRRDRAITLAAAAVVLALGAALAAAIGGLYGLTWGVLLVLVFLTFEARRGGLRSGELALVGTMGLYFASSAGVGPGNVTWFIVGAAVGVAWVAAWSFVLLPYDPAGAVTSAARAFSHRAAALVATVEERLGGANGSRDAGEPDRELQVAMRRIRVGRMVIENQFPGALAPGGWTRARLDALQGALYEAELGLGVLVDAVADPSAVASIPADLRIELVGLLDAMRSSLLDITDAEPVQRLEERAERLREAARAMVRPSSGAGRDDDAPPLPAWVASVVRLALGARRVARALDTVRALREAPHDVAAGGAP